MAYQSFFVSSCAYQYKRLKSSLPFSLPTFVSSGHVIGDGPLAQILHTEKIVHDYREQKELENANQRRHTMLGLFK